jgi:hypothetical protein
MDNDLFERPVWLSYMWLIAPAIVIVSLTSVVVLANDLISGALIPFAMIGAMAPVLFVFALMPVLSNEMRLLDCMRTGLLKPDLTEAVEDKTDP